MENETQDEKKRAVSERRQGYVDIAVVCVSTRCRRQIFRMDTYWKIDIFDSTILYTLFHMHYIITELSDTVHIGANNYVFVQQHLTIMHNIQ